MNATAWNPTLYNQKHSFVYHYGESLVEELNPQPNERILDLGCGTGELTHEISTLGAQVVGIDSSAALITTAQQQFPTLEFRQQNATQLSDSEQYDAIFSNAVLHWISDQAAVTQAVFQALRPGGRLVAEFGGQGNVQAIIAALRETLRQRGYQQQAATEPWYFPSIGQHASRLEEYGFRVQWMRHYSRPTELNDATSGIVDWLRMFAGSFLKGVATDEQDVILNIVQDRLRATLYHNGKWYADYQRLLFRAVRPL